MRVLHVIQELRTGGAERVSSRLARRARRRTRRRRRIRARGARCGARRRSRCRCRSSSGGRGGSRRRAAVRRALREWRPDLVHAHNPAMGLATGLATLRGRGPPGLVSVHGVPDEDWPRPAAASARRAAGRRLRPGCRGCARGARARRDDDRRTPSAPPRRRPTARSSGSSRAPGSSSRSGGWSAEESRACDPRVAAVPDTTLAIVGDGPLRAELEQRGEPGVDDRVGFRASGPTPAR